MQRAFATFEVKSADDSGVIHGIASTPETDRMGDIVEPTGAQFKLPLPLLFQHKLDQPIGHVTEAKVTSAGIEVVARVVRGVDAVADRAWNLIKGGLVRGLSIGYRPIEQSRKSDGGMHVRRWSWLELSAVTIPANSQATVTAVKSAWREQQPRRTDCVYFDPAIVERVNAAHREIEARARADRWEF